MRKFGKSLGWALMALVASMGLSSCTWDKVEPEVCFESEVLPVFVTYCSTTGCHNAQDREKGYDLTNYDGIMRGISPKNVLGSEVLEAMTDSGDDKMPPSGYPQPSTEQISTIKAWVKSGADNTTNCSSVSCDTSAVVSYSADLQPLFGSYCNGCHGGGSPSANLDLSVFQTVKDQSLTGRIQGAMSGTPGYITMPPSGNLLSSCYVDKINKWVAAGAPNN